MNERLAALQKFSDYYLEATSKIRSRYDYPFQRGAFIEHTWKAFDIDYNISALLTSEEPYFAHKELVFAAFCAWLVAPANSQLRRYSIVRAMAQALRRSEDTITEQNHEARFVLEFTNRILQIGPDFFEEIYYPLGGVGAILDCSSPAELRKILKQEAANVERIIFMLQMLHYGAIESQNEKRRRRASKNTILKVIDLLGQGNKITRGLRGRTAGPLWREYEPSMLLLYAAHHVKIRPRPRLKNANFVEAILAREISFEHDIHHISELISRAAYLKYNLSKGIAQETMRILNQFTIPKVPHLETECGKFYGESGLTIESHLKHFISTHAGD